MAGYRVHVEAHAADENPTQLILSEEESRHLVKVRRAQMGSEVTAFDGSGRDWHCRLAKVQGRQAELDVLKSRRLPRQKPEMTLCIALLKGKTMDTVIQKATELGVARIVPLACEHTELKLNNERVENRIAKYRQVAIESCKQCGNSHLPDISPPTGLHAMLEQQTKTQAINLVAALTDEALSIRQALALAQNGNATESITLFVGPEGDFSPQEYHAMREAGFTFITLGPNILRADTAATVFAAIVAEYYR